LGTLINFSTGELRQKNNPKRGKELIAILTMIVVNCVAILNPSIIVLAGKIFDKNLVEEITRRTGFYLQGRFLPRITRDLSNTTGLEGLIQNCREYITTGVHLVKRTGLPHQPETIAV